MTPGRSGHAYLQAGRRPMLLERARHRDVFHQRQVRETPDPAEQVMTHEQGLVASGDAGPA